MDRSLAGLAWMELAGKARELCSVPMDRAWGLSAHRSQSLPGTKIPSKVDGCAATLLSRRWLHHPFTRPEGELMASFMHLPQLTEYQRVRYYF
jgi:hypothetical protein